jgi:hypothetical protein
MVLIVALALALTAFTASDAAARTLYVAPAGSDARGCLTPDTACTSFDRGYHAAAPGDVVEVAAGTYPPQAFSADSSKTSAADVVVRPAPGARVVVGCDGPDNCLATEGADHLTVEGVEIAYLAPVAGHPRQGGVALDRGSADVTFRDIDAGHVWLAASDARVLGGDFGPTVDEDAKIAGGDGSNQLIDGAVFHDMLHHEAHMQCIWLAGANGVTIRNSRFDTCFTFAIFSTPEVGQHFRDVVIENNMFSNSGGVTMSTHVKVGSHGGDCTNFLIRNNTFVDESMISDCGITEGKATNIRWIGNIFERWSGGDCNLGGHGFDFNVIERGSGCGAHDRVVGDAAFVDRAALDFRLRAGSPAIDRGSPSDHPADDIDGNPRPHGSAPDAGADEWGSTGGPGPGAAADRFAPGLRVRIGRRLALRGRRRLVYRATCSEPCRLSASLRAGAGTSRRLGLGRRATVLGRGGARRLAAGPRRVVVGLRTKAVRALRRTGYARVTLSTTAIDRAGNARSVSRRLTLRG